MKTILTILFLFTSFLGAETRYLIVSGDKVKPIPARMSAKATHTVELTVEQMKKSGSRSDWKVVNGLPVLKTDAEREAEELAFKKAQAKKDCYTLYKELRKNFLIQETEVYEFDLEALLLFDSQVKNKADNIKVKQKKQKIKSLSKSKSTAIMGKVNTYLEELANAYNFDWQFIEDGTDFSMPNLKAIQTAQEALKAE
jgi:hypothetical protein